MSDALPTRIGSVLNAGDARALFYKLFTGEVLTAFDKLNVMLPRHRQRNITHGKSAAFANTGRAKGRFHVPGTEITGQDIASNETVITIDDLLIADVFLSNIDEAMNHFEVRGEYSHQLGEALARTFDKQAFRAALAAARSANKITGLPGGTQITLTLAYNTASDANKAIELADAFFASKQKFVENDVPTEGMFAVVTPADYFRLVRNKDLLNRDWGGAGSLSEAHLPQVAGIPLIMSNHVPQQDDSLNVTGTNVLDGGDIVHGKYSGDYSKTSAIVMTGDAIGTVNLLDLALESEYDIRRQGTLMVAKKLCGTGVLRPEAAIEIKRT